MTSVHIKTEKTKGNRGAYHTVFFSLLLYQILESVQNRVFSCKITRNTLYNYNLQLITQNSTYHSKNCAFGWGGGPILNCFRKRTADVSPAIAHHRFNLLTLTKHETFLAASSREWKDYWVWCVWVSNLTHDHHIRYNSLFLLDLAPMMMSRV